MIIPFIASVMRDVFEVTPPMLKESAYGLGSTTWEVVRHVVLPYTKAGVVGGIILGLGRALGETMAVTFIIGNTFNISASLYNFGRVDHLGAGQRICRSGGPVAFIIALISGPDSLPDYLCGAVHFQSDVVAHAAQ